MTVDISSTMDRTSSTNLIRAGKGTSAQSITSLKNNRELECGKRHRTLRTLLQENICFSRRWQIFNDLPNRTAIQDTILPLCKIMQKTKKPICLAVCDIITLKRVMDSWGQSRRRTKVLKTSTQTIPAFFYKRRTFIVPLWWRKSSSLFPTPSLPQALNAQKAIRACGSQNTFHMQGEPVSISISIGIASFTASRRNQSRYFPEQDKQLLSSKEAGRN